MCIIKHALKTAFHKNKINLKFSLKKVIKLLMTKIIFSNLFVKDKC